ncbi:MAG: OprO/OprP family phosphate-selective porin [bacterium]|nr:OprO/OprP family phosphate-selective porin [bacterium]
MSRTFSSASSTALRPLIRPLALALALLLAGGGVLAQEPAGREPTVAELLRRIEALEGRGEATPVTEVAVEQERTDAPTFPTVRITGFFHADAAFYSQDTASKAILGDIDDPTGFRRARLAATGRVAENVSYIVEFDAALQQATFVDVWAQIDDTPVGKVRVGRYRQPFGMDELTSVRVLPFLERNQAFVMTPFRQTGVQVFDTAYDERMTWAISGYRFGTDPFGNVLSDSGGYGVATRITGVVQESEDGPLVHLGFDYSRNDPANGTVRFAGPSELFGGAANATPPSVPLFLDTGAIPADGVDLFNVEAAIGLGRAVVQAEARAAVVDQPSGSQEFRSGYVQARWMLTGEEIPYDRGSATFGRVVPAEPLQDGGWGAFEIAARISRSDFDDTASGRALTATTLGLNWYLNARTKVQFQWTHDELGDRLLGDGTSDAFAVRFHLDF